MLALEAGKHVWIEKPFAVDRAGAERAAVDGIRVGSPACRGPRHLARHGPAELASADRRRRSSAARPPRPRCSSAPGPESWHPNPDFYYQPGGGPLLDMAPYYLSALVQMLGPISRVSASRVERPGRAGDRVGAAGGRAHPGSDAHALCRRRRVRVRVRSLRRVFSFDGHGHGNNRALSVSGSAGHLELPDPERVRRRLDLPRTRAWSRRPPGGVRRILARSRVFSNSPVRCAAVSPSVQVPRWSGTSWMRSSRSRSLREPAPRWTCVDRRDVRIHFLLGGIRSPARSHDDRETAARRRHRRSGAGDAGDPSADTGRSFRRVPRRPRRGPG